MLNVERFSMHPTQKNKRWIVNRPQVFCSDPWSLLKTSFGTLPQNQCVEIISYIEQGKAFFSSALQSEVLTAKPLLFYYAFLNLAKAFIIKSGQKVTYTSAYHGINDDALSKDVVDIKLSIHTNSNPSKPNILEDFWKALYRNASISVNPFTLQDIMPQILPGHRVLCEVTGDPELFLPISKIDFVSNSKTKEVWLQFEILKNDLDSIGAKPNSFLKDAGLDALFVKSKNSECYSCSQAAKLTYNVHPQEKYQTLVYQIKQRIWQNIISAPPYRKYYLFLGATNQPALPQIISSYSVLFALSSIVRYRPKQLLESLDYIPWIEEFLATMPGQLLYTICGEYLETEISKPAIV